MSNVNNIPYSGYSHFISLGYFCSVALDLERFGLRDSAYPFDWCISEFKGVISFIQNHFDDFLEYDKLYQNSKYPYYYANANKIQFFHDFNGYDTLKKQLPQIPKIQTQNKKLLSLNS